MSIAGLGAVAGGFAEGIERGQRIDANNMRITRERKQMQREDDETAAIDAANAAARDVLKRHEADWKKQQPGPTLDGSPVPVNPFKPSPTMILDAGKARTDKLLELRGPTESWAKAWATDEAMRGQFRQQAGQRVKAAMAGGGDLTQPVSEFFSTINDGYDVSSVKPTRGLDGKVTLAIQRVNRYTGQAEPEPIMLPADQFARDIDMLSADPVALAKHSLAMNLEAYKAAQERENIHTRGDESRKTEGVKHSYSLADNADKNRLRLGQISAEGDQQRLTVRERDRLERTRPYTLGDGADRMVDTVQPDGTLKPTKIAGNKKDTPAVRATTAKQLNDLVINNFGVLDVGTGRQVGSAKTQAIAAAAERLIADNPDLGANEAVIQAAKDMGLTITPKK